jgi:hypothetical protein
MDAKERAIYLRLQEKVFDATVDIFDAIKPLAYKHNATVSCMAMLDLVVASCRENKESPLTKEKIIEYIEMRWNTPMSIIDVNKKHS